MGMIVRSELSSALFGKVRWSLLALMFSQPERRFYLRQLVAITRAGHGAVQRELVNLIQGGLLIQEKEGRQIFYRANPKCPIFGEIKAITVKTAGIAEVLRDCLAPLSGEIEEAFIFGSQANGTARSDSDVDLLVVGTVDEMALHKAVTESERKISRPVNYMFLSPEEFHRRHGEKNGFLARVLKSARIPLFGGK